MTKPVVTYKDTVPGALGGSLRPDKVVPPPAPHPSGLSLSQRIQNLSDTINPYKANKAILHGIRIHLRNIASETRKMEERLKELEKFDRTMDPLTKDAVDP